MFRIFLINFGYYSQHEASTLEEARGICRRACFQARVERDGVAVATFCPISGFHELRAN
jgi:hypothetical protein